MVLSIIGSGIANIIGYIFLDQDLVKHEASETAAEDAFAAVATSR